jgi:uncharacterized protein (DUF2252 family)
MGTSARVTDVIEAIQRYNRGRDPELLALKLAKMARDPRVHCP